MSLNPVEKSWYLRPRFHGFHVTQLITLIILIGLPFVPALMNGFVNWDDDSNFLNNQDFRGLSWPHIRWAWTTFLLDVYQPLAWMLLELEYTFCGLGPWGYHALSLILHVAVCLMVLVFILELLERVRGQENPVGTRYATMASVLLFAVHPLRVEVVAWVSCQPYLPCVLFYVIALWAYLRAHPKPAEIQPAWLCIAWVAAAAAVLFKAVALSLPLVLMILDLYPLRRMGGPVGHWFGPIARRAWLEKLPFFALAGGFALLAVLGRGATAEAVPTELNQVSTRLVKAAYGISFYVSESVYPVRPSVYHPPPTNLKVTEYPYFVATLAVGVITMAVLLLGRRAPGLAAVWAAYIATLLPHLGLAVNDTKLVAERYSYISTLPWVVLLAYCLSLPSVWKYRHRLIIPLALVTAIFSVQTWKQCHVWGSSEGLYRQALANTDPNDPFLLNNLGAELLDKGATEEAESCFRRALALKPDDFGSLNNLGLILLQRDQPGAAATCFAKSIEVEPIFADAHKNLGVALERQGLLDQAEARYLDAVKIDPTFSVALAALAALETRQGRILDATAHYSRAVASDPDQPDWLAALGTMLARQGQFERAIVSLRSAVRLRPGYLDARANLGMALMNQGDARGAEQEFQRVLRTRSDHPVALRGLATIRQRKSGTGFQGQ